jgi:LEA14-like dessication related protein
MDLHFLSPARVRLHRFAVGSMVVVLLVVTGAACASLVKEPRVALAEVGVRNLTLSGATIEVELEVENPNGFDLDARALEYTLLFHPGGSGDEIPDESWRTLASGRVTESVTLRANEAVRVPVEIPFRFRDLEEAATSLLRDGTLRYRFEGAFTVGSPVGDLRVPFDRTGLLDL